MSFMAKLFGRGKRAEKAPTPAEAIQRLRAVEEMLLKKQEFLEKKTDQELAIAKQHGTKNKRIAIQALKRKKRYEKQLAQIDGTLTTIEFQRDALENSTANIEIMKILGFAAEALKVAHEDMDIDKVHDLMEDVEEQQNVSVEISEAICRPIGLDLDEDELLKELEELEQEELDDKLLDVGPKLPNVPTVEPKSKQKIVDDLKELESWAS